MKKKIAIMGSTGAIGKILINIIRKDLRNFQIIMLSTNKNYKKILKQAEEFNVKHIIIKDYDSYIKISQLNKKINIYNNFDDFKKIFSTKLDYVLSAISGFEGLLPTIEIIKFTKTIAIANKESIICGWPLIEKKLKKYKTSFVPVDSEHFSIWISLIPNKKIEYIYLTASGGPFLNYSKNQIHKVNVAEAINHPNWNMGKKISVDSATMINKVFEVIEAKNIFNLKFKNIKILIHRNSYIHAILKYKNGITQIIAHDTTMKIPIFNSIYESTNRKINSKKLDLYKLNNLEFSNVDYKRFKIDKILELIPDKSSMFETVLVSANDELVSMFLKNRIKFYQIEKKLINFIKLPEFAVYKKMKIKNLDDIIKLNNYIRLKINDMNKHN